MATSGLAVVLSGVTVIASVTGIYLIHTPVLTSMATGAILAVAVAVLTSTTLTPAVLATFGRSRGQTVQGCCTGPAGRRRRSRGSGPAGSAAVMRRPWLSALARHAVPAGAGRAGVLDGAGQQHAAAVPGDARDPRRCRCGGRGAGPRRAGPGAGPGDLPRRRRVDAAEHRPVVDAIAQEMSRAINVVVGVPAGVLRRQPQRPAQRRCCPSIPRTWRPATPSTGCANNCRRCPAPRPRADRRGRSDRADQGLRRPGGRRPNRWCSASSR